MRPLLTIPFYLFKQLEMGHVCNFKMLQTMLSEKLVGGGIPIDYSLFLVQTVWNGTCLPLYNAFKKIEVRVWKPSDYSFLFVQTAWNRTCLPL